MDIKENNNIKKNNNERDEIFKLYNTLLKELKELGEKEFELEKSFYKNNGSLSIRKEWKKEWEEVMKQLEQKTQEFIECKNKIKEWALNI